MAVNPMMESARVNGLNSALKGLNRAAQEVAEFNVDPATSSSRPASADQAEALLSLKLYQREAQAAAKVVTTADAVLGFLLDVHA